MSRPLRLAIVHYHLKRGGVTRVIDSTLRGLAGIETPPHCVVLSGEAAADPAFPGTVACLEDLSYSNTRERDPDPGELAAKMRAAAEEVLGGAPDIWHIHNHSLGKNGAFPGAVNVLAESGEALLLQMHDFAEDGRPGNYRFINSASGTAALYPISPRVHYAVLNGRDREFFGRSGIDPAQLHLLPNPVDSPAEASSDPATIRRTLDSLRAERLLLCPVRAVRRKNLGELLLWAALAEKGTVIANSLGPTNRNFIAPYERWKVFADELRLPIFLGLCENTGPQFEDVIAASSALISTSIAEGFGLGFLEPWLHGKPACGRDLPEITSDFTKQGIILDTLYPHLYVPESWIQMDDLRSAIRSGLEASYRAYGKALPEDAPETALRSLTDDAGRIDFGGLDEAMQESVIQKVATNPGASREMEPSALKSKTGGNTIERNRSVIREHYSVDCYAGGLHALYERIADGKPGSVDALGADKVLDAFMDPSRFRLLRT